MKKTIVFLLLLASCQQHPAVRHGRKIYLDSFDKYRKLEREIDGIDTYYLSTRRRDSFVMGEFKGKTVLLSWPDAGRIMEYSCQADSIYFVDSITESPLDRWVEIFDKGDSAGLIHQMHRSVDSGYIEGQFATSWGEWRGYKKRYALCPWDSRRIQLTYTASKTNCSWRIETRRDSIPYWDSIMKWPQ